MGGVPSVELSFLMSTISWRGENGYNGDWDDSISKGGSAHIAEETLRTASQFLASLLPCFSFQLVGFDLNICLT